MAGHYGARPDSLSGKIKSPRQTQAEIAEDFKFLEQFVSHKAFSKELV
jgi:hypothetical protein